jgi:rhodanese-related sulfurtransferase
MGDLSDMGDYVPPTALQARLQEADAPTVIDVRDAVEYGAGHIPGALHIPGDQLPERLGEGPRGRPVVTY